MRQVIARVDDDLHTKLKSKAAQEGRSLNDLLVEALEAAAKSPADGRAALRRTMAGLGMLASRSAAAPNPKTRDRLISKLSSGGEAIVEALDSDRATR